MYKFAVALTLCAAATTPAVATTAIVIDGSICDNQVTSMNHEWYKDVQSAETINSFYFNGVDFVPIQSSTQPSVFNQSDKIFIASHGAAGSINSVPGAAFATSLKAAHGSVPTSINFMVCYSAQPPGVNQLSVLGRVAAQYPAETGNGTAIGNLTGSTDRCTLIGPAARYPQAVQIQGVDASPVRTEAVLALQQAWSSEKYPQTETDFKTYCKSLTSSGNFTALPAFMDTVFRTFYWRYLVLININRGGTPLYTCGAAESKVCQ